MAGLLPSQRPQLVWVLLAEGTGWLGLPLLALASR